MLEHLQVSTIPSDYNLLPHIWNLPLSQCKETLQKPEEVQESQYNMRGSKGSPRIPSKNILFFPSMHMWKKCLWNNGSLHNISSQKCWNYLSTDSKVFAAAIPCSDLLKTCVLHSLLLSWTWTGKTVMTLLFAFGFSEHSAKVFLKKTKKELPVKNQNLLFLTNNCFHWVTERLPPPY